jgi:hypothetical protein
MVSPFSIYIYTNPVWAHRNQNVEYLKQILKQIKYIFNISAKNYYNRVGLNINDYSNIFIRLVLECGDFVRAKDALTGTIRGDKKNDKR